MRFKMISEKKQSKLKRSYLSVPIEVYKCEIILRKTQQLTKLEKLMLKFIDKEKSLSKVLEAFNTDTFIMNKILTNLYYRNLIHLDLNRVLVFLDDEAKKMVDNNSLDEYYGELPIDEKRTVTIIQEKIQGEIFSGSDLGDYLKNPGFSVAEYFDLASNPPDSYIDIKEFSLNKYAKIVKKELRASPQDIIKINWLRQLHSTSLYIPLTEKNEKKYINIDYDIVPRDIQKIWQYSYEREFVDSEEQELDFFVERPFYLLNRHYIIDFFKDLNLFIGDLKKFQSKRDFIGFRNLIEDIEEELELYIEIIKEKISSINKMKFILNKNILYEQIKEKITHSKNFIIIISPTIDNVSLIFYKPLFQSCIERNVKIILISGGQNRESIEEEQEKIKDYANQFFIDIEKKYHENFEIILSNKIIISNYINIDNYNIIFNNQDLLGFNYEENEDVIPTIISTGGNIPFKFLEFFLANIPYNFKWREEFEKLSVNSHDKIYNNLDRERKDFIVKLELLGQKTQEFKMDSINEIIRILDDIKKHIKSYEKFDTLSTILNFEHRGIIIDSMRELQQEFEVFTDTIYKNQIGPNFRKYLYKCPNFSIYLNTNNLKMNESDLNIALAEFDRIEEKNSQLKYFVNQKQYILNLLAIKNGFIIFTNERFFESSKMSYSIRKSSIGLIINSPNINRMIDSLSKLLEID